MYCDVVDRFLGTQNFARQAEILMSCVEGYSGKTCEDDYMLACKSQFLGPILAEIEAPWTIWAVAFGNFLVKRWNASAGMTASVVSSLALATTPRWIEVRRSGTRGRALVDEGSLGCEPLVGTDNGTSGG